MNFHIQCKTDSRPDATITSKSSDSERQVKCDFCLNPSMDILPSNVDNAQRTGRLKPQLCCFVESVQHDTHTHTQGEQQIDIRKVTELLLTSDSLLVEKVYHTENHTCSANHITSPFIGLKIS